MRLRRSSQRLCLLLLLTAAALTSACSNKSVAEVTHESDAIEIVDVLKENDFEVSKEEVGEGASRKWRVVVEEGLFGGDDAERAMQVMRYYGLPRPEDKGLEGAYDEPGMFPSESAQSAQRTKELKTEVERQLRMLSGVTRVSVTIVLPEDSTFKLNPRPAKAGVLIVCKNAPPSFTVEEVQKLVAGGLPVNAENVSVSITQQPPLAMPRQRARVQQRTMFVLIILGVLLVSAAAAGWMWWRKTHPQRASAPAADGPQKQLVGTNAGQSQEFAALAGADGDGQATSGAPASRQLPASGKRLNPPAAADES